MPVRELSAALSKKAQDELGEVPSRIPDDLKAIKEWLSKQPHITANLDDQWLLAFLRGCKFSLERTKEKIEAFHTSKTLVPNITMPADPTDKKFLEYFRFGGCIALKTPISEDGPIVIIYRPGVFDADTFSVPKFLQIHQMMIEIMMLENDNVTVSGLTYISDLKKLTMNHLTQITPVLAQKVVLCMEKSLPLRQKGAHNINLTSGIETMFNFIIKFFGEKFQNRIFVHGQNSEELFKHIPKAILPVEYGGNAGPISEHIDYWEKKLISYKEYFLKSRQYKTDERKRIGKPKTADELFGVEGSFRALNVD